MIVMPRTVAAHFLPPLHALERCDRLRDRVERHAVEVRRADRHRGVAHIEFADAAGCVKRVSSSVNSEPCGVVAHVADVARGIRRKADLHELRAAVLAPRRRSSASSPLISTMPFSGTMFSSRRKLSLISSRSSKMSA